MEAIVYSPGVSVKTKWHSKVKMGTIVKGIVMLTIIAFIKIISSFPFFIERYYSRGVYPYISAFFRIFFGWLPFSFGDIFYFATGCYLLFLLIKILKTLFQRSLNRVDLLVKTKSFLLGLSVVYIYFNLAWGLNYNRPGVAVQLGLTPQMHNVIDLKNITAILLEKVNESRQQINTLSIKNKNYQQVFDEAQQAFQAAAIDFPFMSYKAPSVKRSMYGRMGNFLGFLGYYNPFTGEAQLNLTMPRFLIPYVSCHEMAHQLGYASESEASFVGYLAAAKSKDVLFQYSSYFDMFTYANRELYIRDSTAAKENYKLLDPLVKTDMTEVKEYWRKSDNIIEPVIKLFYDNYLKANQQQNGLKSYNEVVGWLIAYNKKYATI